MSYSYTDQLGSKFEDLEDIFNQLPSSQKDNENNSSQPVAEGMSKYKKAKGVTYQPHFFEQFPPRQKKAFLKSTDYYPFLNRKGKLIVPPIKDIPQPEVNDEVDIHVLDFARAFNGDFASNGGVVEHSTIGTDVENN